MRADATRYVGVIPPDATGGITFGGVNGGTLRAEGVPNLIVRLVAFGERGAFGEPEQINRFAPPEACAPEPDVNLAYSDISRNTNSHLVVLNDGDQTVTFQDNVGPHKRHNSECSPRISGALIPPRFMVGGAGRAGSSGPAISWSTFSMAWSHSAIFF